METNRTLVRISPGGQGAETDWVTEPAGLHIHNHRFDEYDTEVVSIDAEYEHRPFIRELEWDQTHRKWTGHTWKVDFEALETVVHHLVTSGFSVTMEPNILRIYVADYDCPFLESVAPSESSPDGTHPQVDGQMRLSDFDQNR